MTLQEQYEKETNKKWWINPVCHGDRGFCSDEYMKWLEQKAEAGEKAIELVQEIRNTVHAETHFEWTQCELRISKLFSEYDSVGE